MNNQQFLEKKTGKNTKTLTLLTVKSSFFHKGPLKLVCLLCCHQCIKALPNDFNFSPIKMFLLVLMAYSSRGCFFFFLGPPYGGTAPPP